MRSFTTALILFVFTITCIHAKSAAISPDELRCEYRNNPFGIDTLQPRLSWILKPAAPELTGLRQTGFQILVASSPVLLAKNQGDLWDSGKVASAQMNQVAYTGVPLTSDQPVWWKVRVWDGKEQRSAWSPIARWTMGILSDADWRGAKWIGAPDANEPFNPNGDKGPKAKYETVLLRHDLEVKPGLQRALVHICGLAQYEMTLNGNKVGDAVLTPGWTAYDKTCLYDSYDITTELQPGENAIGVFLGNGFYNTHNGRYTKVRGSYGPLQAIVLVRLEYADGTVENVVTDEKWRTSSGPIVFSSIYGGEDFDARLVQAGWDKPGFGDSAWDQPATTKGPGGKLKGLSAAAPPIRLMQVLKPVGRRQINPNIAVYDLGQNAAFMTMITVKGAAGATVKVTPSELVNDNGDINERMCNNDSYCIYTLNGKGEETNLWKFYYRGGRYLRVETQAAPGTTSQPEVTAVEGHVIRADSPSVGEFACSNDLFNKVFSLIRWAQMNNMMSIMTDCPHREKLGWLEEDHLNGPALRYNFDMSALFGKMVNDMFDAQRANGLVPSLVPNYYRWDEGKFTTPIEWGSACIIVPWQQYEFEGDVQLLADRYAGMKRYLDYITRRAQNHIVSFGLGDWYDNHSEGEPTLTPVGLTDTAFYYQDCQILAQIAKLLGNADEAAQFEQQGAEVLKAFNQKYFDAAITNYASGAQGSLCLPLAMNMTDPANRSVVLNRLLEDMRAKGTTAGEVSFRYLLRALADQGRSDFIYTTYSTDTQGYGLQVKLGKTSLTEAWNGGNASQDHFMFGQINEWFYHDLAGIQCDPAGPGFEEIIIKPALVGDLTWAKASYHSIRGDIVSSWTHGLGGLTMNVTIPVGSTATIHVPAADAAVVKEGGVPAGIAPGVRFLRMENGAAVYAVGSGAYNFSSRDEAVAPGRFTAIAQSGKVVLTWTPSVNGTSYLIRRATAPDTGYSPLVKNLKSTTYTDTGLKNGTTYYYEVFAVNGLGESRGVKSSATPATIVNFGFETPTIRDYVINPAGAGWNFTAAEGFNGSGITRNGSGYTGANPTKIPEGEQAAILQGTGTISQTIGGLVPGTVYTLTFSAAQRVSSNNGGQTWQINLDGRSIGDYSPDETATTFTDYTATFKASAVSQTLSFVGTNKRGGDNTILLDNIRLAAAPQ
jgi:hypothetical protein